MEPIIVLVILVVLGLPLALAIWLIARAVASGNRIEDLSRRVGALESELFRLRQERERRPAKSSEPTPAPQSETIPERQAPVRGAVETIAASQPEAPRPAPSHAPSPKPAFPPPSAIAPPVEWGKIFARPSPSQVDSARQPARKINWEQFMGVKGLAWIGGFALFLGVAFFVKYSFDNNLVPPELRVAIGFLVGLGLLAGGGVLSRRNFPALSQTLCATGIVILYAVAFAGHSVYHFKLFGTAPTFLLMALITAAAFLIAVRLDALVVAVLGMLGGFLTPLLLSTGQDNPPGLFGYLAILDTGLIVVALNKRWHFLVGLAALGTALMQITWAGEFFEAEKYFEGNKILVALAVLLGFNVLWLAALWLNRAGVPFGRLNQGCSAPKSRTRGRNTRVAGHWLSGSALGLAAVAFAFSAWFLDFAPLAQRPWLMFGFVFLVDLSAAAVPPADESVSAARAISGFGVFGLLAFWTSKSLSAELLDAGLVFYFIFALFHSALPAWRQHRRGATAPGQADHFFPILSLALMLAPIFKFAGVSFIVWPFILLVDLLAILLAALTATLLPVLAVLLLTLAALGALIFKIPADLTGLPMSFFLLGAFVLFFVIASVWLARKFNPQALKTGIHLGSGLTTPGDVAAMLPACSIVLPFLLLVLATLRLPLVNPSPVFGLALLLVALLLGLAGLFSLDWMPAIGLVCVTALECAWHFNRLAPVNPDQPLNLVLAWYLIFFAVFAWFPFLFLKKFGGKVVPWAAAAMAGPPQFLLIYRLVKIAWPNPCMGLLPAAFAIPGLLSVGVVLKRIPAGSRARLTQLAWFGGVGLFFITLIFPIQFEHQWITLGWALEGAALLWLFHRVPHPGLRLVGVGLLAAAFARLALNPAVLSYHPRAATAVFNWYLYAYGIVAAALFTGSRLLAPPRDKISGTAVPPVLAGLGTVLAFLLLNIEIADYFSAPGSTLTFQFSGDFARDMTYSIAWALFALGLLVYGILKRVSAARYSAMGLFCVTLAKLFFHDLARLGQLYRIGAFVGVAIIAMLASFAYQKYFAGDSKGREPGSETAK